MKLLGFSPIWQHEKKVAYLGRSGGRSRGPGADVGGVAPPLLLRRRVEDVVGASDASKISSRRVPELQTSHSRKLGRKWGDELKNSCEISNRGKGGSAPYRCPWQEEPKRLKVVKWARAHFQSHCFILPILKKCFLSAALIPEVCEGTRLKRFLFSTIPCLKNLFGLIDRFVGIVGRWC